MMRELLPARTRIVVVEDHAIVRDGIRRILAAEPDLEVVALCAEGEGAAAIAKETDADVVVLDIGLPGLDGVEVLAELRRLHPRAAVVVLSMYPEDQCAIGLLQSGASAYLAKSRAPDELVAAVRRVASGGRYITDRLGEQLVDATSIGRPHDRLSMRELQVLRGIGEGKTVSRIAEGLGLSVKTVSTYRARLLAKLHLGDTAELMRYAIAQERNPLPPAASPVRGPR
jgi:DNA-binding NarL/FixJ family response regulator